MARNKTALLGASPTDGQTVRVARREAIGDAAMGDICRPFSFKTQNHEVLMHLLHPHPEAACRVPAPVMVWPEGDGGKMPNARMRMMLEKLVAAVAGRMVTCQKITPALGK